MPQVEFLAKQNIIWEKICQSSLYAENLFCSINSMKDLDLCNIKLENNLLINEKNILEFPAISVLNTIFQDKKLNCEFGLPSQIKFLSANNLSTGSKIKTTIENLFFVMPDKNMKSNILLTSLTPKVQKKAKQSPNLSSLDKADQFYIYYLKNKREVIKYNLKYKPHFKFTLNLIMVGLQGKICSKQDVIGYQPSGFEANSKQIVSTVIIQLFFYIIKNGVQYSYISTREVIIFLNIMKILEIVQYHLSIPQLKVNINDLATLHQTAIAQIIAFNMYALTTKAPSQL